MPEKLGKVEGSEEAGVRDGDDDISTGRRGLTGKGDAEGVEGGMDGVAEDDRARKVTTVDNENLTELDLALIVGADEVEGTDLGGEDDGVGGVTEAAHNEGAEAIGDLGEIGGGEEIRGGREGDLGSGDRIEQRELGGHDETVAEADEGKRGWRRDGWGLGGRR